MTSDFPFLPHYTLSTNLHLFAITTKSFSSIAMFKFVSPNLYLRLLLGFEPKMHCFTFFCIKIYIPYNTPQF